VSAGEELLKIGVADHDGEGHVRPLFCAQCKRL
jgi:hypothetical protein